MRVLETKVAKFATWYSLSFKPWNLIGCFILSIASSLAGKKMRFKAKKVVRFRANQITGTSVFKMGVTFFFVCFFNRLFLRKAGGSIHSRTSFTWPYIVVKRKVRFRKVYLIQKFLNCVVLTGHPFELKTFLLRLIPFQNSNHWATDSTVGEVHYEVHMTRVPHTAGISNVGSVMPCI